MGHVIRNLYSRLTGHRPSPPPDPLFHSTLVNSLVGEVSARLGKPCELVDFRSTRTGSLVVRVRADRPYVAKLPLRASTEPRLRKSAQTLVSLRQAAWMTPLLSERIPSIVLLGSVQETFYSVETTVAGRDGASIVRGNAGPEDLLRSAAQFLVELHRASASTTLPRAAWEAAFEASVERVERLASEAGTGRTYRGLVSCVRTRLAAQPIPAVFSHGNFWLGNALFDEAASLTGVIDWDCAADAALPGLDFIYLLIRTHSMARSASFGEGLTDWIEATSLPFLDSRVVQYCRQVSIPADLVETLSYCTWIEHVDQHCRFGTTASTNPRWVNRNVVQVLERWQRRKTRGHCSVVRWNAAGCEGERPTHAGM